MFLFFLQINAQAQQKTIASGLEGISDVKNLTSQLELDKWISKIDKVSDSLKNSNIYSTLIDGKSAKFPLAIKTNEQNSDYALIINKVDLNAVTGMTAEIFMKIPFRNKENLYFLADKVPLSKTGKLSGDFKLLLLKSTSFKIGKGYSITINGLNSSTKGFDSTFVTFDCKGFKEITISGSVDFDPNTIVQQSSSGPGNPLNLKFFVKADRLTNVLLHFKDIPPVQFKSLPDFKCTIPELIVDRSEIRNIDDFTFPKWYKDSIKKSSPDLNLNEFFSEKWEGVYIPLVKIEMPKYFTEDSKKQISTIEVKNLIVDQQGLSFLAQATEVLDGELKSFKYSVDTFKLGILESKLSKAGIAGKMVFPINKETSSVNYTLTITASAKDNELAYQGSAELNTNIHAEAFGLAQIHITRGYLDFQYKNKQFFPKVELDGSITIAAKKKADSSASGNMGLEFGKFQILSVSPYIALGENGYFRLKGGGGDSKLAKLPISIDTVTLISQEGGQRLGLQMAIAVHLQNSKSDKNSSGNGFAGKADFTIWTKRNAVSRKWGYDDFSLNEISLKIENGSFKLDGSLKMFTGDTVYGQGYCGFLNVELIDKIKVSAAAIFGKKTTGIEPSTSQITNVFASKKDTITFATNTENETISTGATVYRYWFVDAMISFSPGIPIFSGVELNSFTGGLYYNMKMLKPGTKIETKLDCKTASGRTFIPNDSCFGVLAGIGIQSMGGGNAFNGEINFGIEFNKVIGGISKIATWGEVGFLTMNFEAPAITAVASKMSATPVNQTTQSQATTKPTDNKSSIMAGWYVEYDFPNKTLSGDFDIYVELGEIVKGQYNGKAGNIKIYSSPGIWYLYIGRPTQNEMLGLNVLNLATIGGYMCVGNTLPNPPIAPLPAEITPRVNIDYKLLSMGGGLSFGARFTIQGDPGIKLKLCDAYVKLDFTVQTGFDILLSKSNQPVFCADRKEGRGFQNWYATGQAFLYGQASLVAGFDCGFYAEQIDLGTVFLKAYVFAQLPNPTFLQGGLEAGFRFRGEIHKESFDFKKGDQCLSDEDKEKDINFISAITPVNDQKDVATGEKIHVYFSNRVNSFEYKIINNKTNQEDIFRAFLTKKNVTVTAGVENIEFEFELEKPENHLVLTPVKAFPGNTEITVTVKLITQVKRGNDWEETKKTEIKTVKFRTIADPGYIPVTDIYYAYPMPGMDNFYKNETTKGYIRLSVLPRKAVELKSDYEFAIAIIQGNNEIDRIRNVKYVATPGANNFEFTIPTFRMDLDKEYTLKLMKSPRVVNFTDVDIKNGNVKTGTVKPTQSDSTILEYKFRTSKYASYTEKMATYNTTFSEIFDGVSSTQLSTSSKTKAGIIQEGLTDSELKGVYVYGIKHSNALLQFSGIDYEKASQDEIEKKLQSIGSVNLKNGSNGGYTAVNTMITDLNSQLNQTNMNCLIKGNCTTDELRTVKIPQGKFAIKMGYYPPGTTIPTSEYKYFVELTNDLVLPQ